MHTVPSLEKWPLHIYICKCVVVYRVFHKDLNKYDQSVSKSTYTHEKKKKKKKKKHEVIYDLIVFCQEV